MQQSRCMVLHNSCRGIGTTATCTTRPCETCATTLALSHIGTGLAMRTAIPLYRRPRSSTLSPGLAATVSRAPTHYPPTTTVLRFQPYQRCSRDAFRPAHLLHVGPNRRFTDHCLVRSLSNDHRGLMTTAYINGNILSQATYDNFWNSLDGLPFKPDFRLHDAGHATVGGDMSSFYTSPNDPIFYPHHAGLDRVWDKWQRADLNNRLYAMEGRVNYQPPYGQITLNYRLPFPGLSSSVPIRDTMDIHREPYCYTYA